MSKWWEALRVARENRECDVDEFNEQREIALEERGIVALEKIARELGRIRYGLTPRLVRGYITHSAVYPSDAEIVTLHPFKLVYMDGTTTAASGNTVSLLESKPLLKGEFPMPLALQIGQSSTATFNGVDQFGQPFPIDFTQGNYKIAWSAADSSAVGLTPNADGTVVVAGVAASDGDALTAAVTRPDGVVISTSDSVSVGAPPPPVAVLTSGSISFSTPS